MISMFSLEWLAWSKGLATSAGLIMAIGAQNAFVLTQSLRREFHWPIALLCMFFDAVLMTAGVIGLGVAFTQSPLLLEIARWGGALFLFWFGIQAAKRALGSHSLSTGDSSVGSLKRALLTTAAVTLLNPHAYIDTIVLIGGIGGQYEPDLRVWFAVGAITFSVIWFSSLCIGARWLAPLFSKPLAWRVLDGLICLMMWSIALSLLVAL
ncbi:LysE/ArgO family amino acid transporter [Marinobacterium sediminicola]|uniref:L-lysine exporter family protein LysE/ArgO n=1 Tax=Marinobacterium sediminicola TaxID=518898 RepID=A0ABY1RWJ4_9GAMM|nr:LysE/ArgO family amino acid transporter [Marinobacterium sediminicola]ULG70338.1 LysE/ArgO family amino acid transporter [Marinobacterium sediminicola]SMR69695.1 L-lysine exporter family protein LysE/ArgO [Marinobacterium sediminicola]